MERGFTAMAGRDLTQDGLRGLAALSVLVAHLDAGFLSEDLGQGGVRLFFLVSGYCIFLSLDRHDGAGVGHFIFRRFFRLFPVYWVSLFFGVWLLGQSPSLGMILANMTMLQKAMGYGDVVAVYWTLFYEIIFYAVALFLFVIGQSQSLRGVGLALVGSLTLGLISAAIRGFTGMPLPISLFVFVSLFLGGGILYLLQRDGALPLWKLMIAVAAALLALSAMPYLVAIGEPVGANGWWPFARYSVSAVFVFVLLTVVTSSKSRWLAWLGQISYSLYLFHEIVIHVVRDYVDGVSSYLLSIFISLLVAQFAWIGVENPGIALGRHLLRKLGLRKPCSV